MNRSRWQEQGVDDVRRDIADAKRTMPRAKALAYFVSMQHVTRAQGRQLAQVEYAQAEFAMYQESDVVGEADNG